MDHSKSFLATSRALVVAASSANGAISKYTGTIGHPRFIASQQATAESNPPLSKQVTFGWEPKGKPSIPCRVSEKM